MQQALVLKALSHTVIGILLVTLLVLLLVALRKELSVGVPLRGIVHLGFTVIGVCTFVALMAAYFHATKMILPQSKFQRIDTARVFQSAGVT
jgi:hypothetical protein